MGNSLPKPEFSPVSLPTYMRYHRGCPFREFPFCPTEALAKREVKLAYRVDRLYSYIVTHDTAFAPNPFWGVCTLACCKPKIRKSAGDHLKANPSKSIWVVGLSPKHNDEGNDIIYIMKVDAVMSFADYYRTHPEKRPDFEKKMVIYKSGDNIYEPEDSSGFRYRQLRSLHSLNPHDDDHWAQNPESIEHDLGGGQVLLSPKFVYFGSAPVALPLALRELVAGRGHKCKFSPETLVKFARFLDGYRDQIDVGAVLNKPHNWPASDGSWKQ
jgi:hypothetical protein